MGSISERYDAAYLLASRLHRGQTRKSSRGVSAPYLSHLLRVSGLTYEYGADEDVAIAALLHDAVEDCGGLTTLELIRAEFGDAVAGYVRETSDSLASDPQRKAPWRERKEAYVARLASASDGAVLISACDKIDNARSFSRELLLAEDRASFMSRFHAGAADLEWYYRAVLAGVRRRNELVAIELEYEVDRLIPLLWVK